MFFKTEKKTVQTIFGWEILQFMFTKLVFIIYKQQLWYDNGEMAAYSLKMASKCLVTKTYSNYTNQNALISEKQNLHQIIKTKRVYNYLSHLKK